jgi:2'-5' RNA ligase
LRARHPQARWTPASKLHLTLVFLGATDPAELPRISAGAADVAGRWSPFTVASGDGGGYLGRRGGVAWLTIVEGHHQAALLSREVDQALASGTYEKMSPRPHLTLARKVDEVLLADVRDAAASLHRQWLVDRIVLYRSHTGPGSAQYEELSSFALGRTADADSSQAG